MNVSAAILAHRLSQLGLAACCVAMAATAIAQQQTPVGGAQPSYGGIAAPNYPGAPQPNYSGSLMPDYSAVADPVNASPGTTAGPFVVYPSIAVTEGYNDNVTLRQNNQIKSAVTVIAPALVAEVKGASTTFNLGYFGAFTRYSSSSADNIDSNAVRANAIFDFTARSRLSLLGSYSLGADPRGSTFASTGVATPNRFRTTQAGGVFSYGAAGAQGRIEVEGLATQTRYINNRTVTATLDFDSYRYGGTFFWRIGPKTEWLIQATQIDTNYLSATSIQDGHETRYLTGVKWEATAATTGMFKIGYAQKRYDSPLSPKQSTGIWEGGIQWSPLSYSKVYASTGRYIADASGGGVGLGALGASSVKTSFYNLAWTHQWTERISSNLRGGYLVEDYVGGLTNRSDKTSTAGAGLFYTPRRWLTLAADYSYSDRSSNVGGFGYTKNLIMFSLRASM